MSNTCPFCQLPADRVRLENSAGIAMLDAYPVAEGHTLVVPKQHVASLYELSAADQVALWHLAAEVRLGLRRTHRLAGFNIGINDGQAAGQTVLHAHIHVIPRCPGDVADPGAGSGGSSQTKARIGEVGCP